MSDFKLFFDDAYLLNGILLPTGELNLEQISPYAEDLTKIKAKLNELNRVVLKPDFNDFHNHTFFASALTNVNIAIDRVQKRYPFDGTLAEVQEWEFSGSGFERFLADKEYPKFVGQINFNGSDQYITASDGSGLLAPGSGSITFEFWLNLAKETKARQNIFELTGSDGYFRTRKVSGSFDLVFEINSGTISNAVTASIASGSWVYVANIFNRASGTLQFFTGSATNIPLKVSEVTSSIQGKINLSSSLFYVATGTVASNSGQETLSASLDEVRVWHTASIPNFLRRNFARTVYAQDYLKLLYRFNESITTTGSIDRIIIDYSGKEIDGKYVNYVTGSSRQSGSIWLNEVGEFVLYPTHPDVITFTNKWQTSGSIYDSQNDNLILNLVPGSMLLDDEENGSHLNNLLLIIGRFFDDIKLYVDQFENILYTNYDDLNESPDIFLPTVAEFFGWKLGKHFVNADTLAYLYGENIIASGSIAQTLSNVKNSFYERILNNLIYLHKTRGTRESLLALLRLYGVNENLIKIKEYGDLKGKTISDARIHGIRNNPVLWFGSGSTDSNNISASAYLGVHQTTLSTSLGDNWTTEIRCRLPHTASTIFSGSFLTGVIWSWWDANAFASGTVAKILRLQYERNDLTSSLGKLAVLFTGTTFTGSIFKTDPINIFDGNWHNFAVSYTKDSNELKVRNYKLAQDAIDLSGAFSSSGIAQVAILTSAAVFPVLGATYPTLFPSNLYDIPSTMQAQEFRLWQKSLSDAEIKEHTFNYRNLGTEDPKTEFSKLKLNYRVNDNSIAGSDGLFYVNDYTKTRLNLTSSRAAVKGFLADKNPFTRFDLDFNFLSPEIDLKWRDNKIRIHSGSQIKNYNQAKDNKAIDFELNLVDALNEDISNIFVSLQEFNNIIGRPENYFRDQYLGVDVLARTYFDRLEKSLNFKQFFDLFKWFDLQFMRALEQVVPAKANFLGGIFAVESHILERNKFDYKYPIIRTPPVLPVSILSASASFPKQEVEFLSLSGSVNSIYNSKQSKIFAVSGSISKITKKAEYIFGDNPPFWGLHSPQKKLVYELFPNATGSLSGWSVVGAANAWQVVDEEPHDSDVTYITASQSGKATTVSFSDVSDTTSVVENFRVFFTHKVASGSDPQVGPLLISGATVHTASLFINNFTYDISSFNFLTSVFHPGNWTIGELNNVEVGALYVAADVGMDEIRITQIKTQITTSTVYPETPQFYKYQTYLNGVDKYNPNYSWINTRNERVRNELTKQHQKSGSYQNYLYNIGNKNNKFVHPMIGDGVEYRLIGSATPGNSFIGEFDQNGAIKITNVNRIHMSASTRNLLPPDIIGSDFPALGMLSGAVYYNFRWPRLQSGSVPAGSVGDTGIGLKRMIKCGQARPAKEAVHEGAFLPLTPEINYGMGLGQLMFASIIGSQNKGQIGLLDSDVITTKLVGSRVVTLWPQQLEQFTLSQPSTGSWLFAGVGPGQEPGLLTIGYQDGPIIQLSEIENISRVFVYLQIDAAASLSNENIFIRTQRSPLIGFGMGTKQETAILTGSARLDDLVYNKAFPVFVNTPDNNFSFDIDLGNAAEFRLQVKRNQTAANLSCLILARIDTDTQFTRTLTGSGG